jgi:hypothetical protein
MQDITNKLISEFTSRIFLKSEQALRNRTIMSFNLSQTTLDI